jgi:HAD superfamily hydrolase (TIGR01662 family)
MARARRAAMVRRMSRIENVRWIFFDVGYTLLDETAAWHEQFRRLSTELGRRGRDVGVEALWQAFHDSCRDFAPKQWHAVCAAFAANDAEAIELVELGTGWRHDLERPHARAIETLVALAKHHKLGIIANQSLGTRDRMLNHRMLDSISLVIGSAEAGVHKPDPRIFLQALKEAGCDATDAAMVGDRIDNDVKPANLLGMKTVHVRQGGSGAQRPREASEVATVTVETIAEVAAIFASS